MYFNKIRSNCSHKFSLTNSWVWLGVWLGLWGWGFTAEGVLGRGYPSKYSPREKGSIYSIIPIHIRSNIIPLYIRTRYYTMMSNTYKSYTKNYYWNNSIQEMLVLYWSFKKIPKNKKRGIDIELELNDNEHTD